jgi:FKBP-type peptidyl-prolyl cis-trans isomerase
MKRQLLIGSALVVTSACLVVICGQKNTKIAAPAAPTIQSESKKMTRTKNASGLEYEIIQPGSGVSPSAGKEVTVHYTGWLDVNGEKGQQFDSSLTRGTPFVFVIGVHQVIQGWDEGVMTMKIGEKRRLYIPAKLGYGARGAGAIIKPNSNLIFEVELLKVS